MVTSKIETITPELAEEYLKHSKKNRKIKPKSVEALARDIKRGKFLITNQGIGFDIDGNLCDGQHRLLAVIMARTSIQMMVVRGLNIGAACVVDRGAARSVRDVMQIENNENMPEEMYNMMTNQKVLSALSQLVECSDNVKKIKVNAEDTKRLLEEFRWSVTEVYKSVITKAGSKARAPMISAAIAAVDCGVDIDVVSKFFYIFFKDDISGCDNFNVGAALNWRRQIDKSKVNKVTIGARKLYLGTQNAIYHFANNTGVQKIVSPAECRYNVGDKVIHALGI